MAALVACPEGTTEIAEVPAKPTLAGHPHDGEHGVPAVDIDCNGASLGVLEGGLVGRKVVMQPSYTATDGG
jgi:hypothetical protein